MGAMKIIHIVILAVLGIGTGMYLEAMHQQEMPWRRQEMQRRQGKNGDTESLLRAIRPAAERIIGPSAPSRQPSQPPRSRVIIPAGPTAAEIAAQREAEMAAAAQQVQEQRRRRELQEQELKEESERVRQSWNELEEWRQQLLQAATKQGEAYGKIERELVGRQESIQRREQERQEIERKEQKEFVARKSEVQRQLARFEDLLLSKAEQKKRLPSLLKGLMEPLFTALRVMNDKGARRNIRNIIKRLIQAVNREQAIEGRIPQDNPDANDLTSLLIQSIDRSMKADQPLLGPNDFAVVDLLQALHAGDLQRAIQVAQSAYRGSYSFGDDFTIKKFDREYKDTLADIVLMGMFEHGRPFEFLLREPQGGLWEQADAMMAQHEQEKEELYERGLEALSDDEEERASLRGF